MIHEAISVITHAEETSTIPAQGKGLSKALPHLNLDTNRQAGYLVSPPCGSVLVSGLWSCSFV